MTPRPSALPCAALALAAALFATPVAAQLTTIRVCVVQGTELREIEAQYNALTGDTTVAGRLFREVHPLGPDYAAGTTWYVDNDPIEIDGTPFVKYGLPRVLGVADLMSYVQHEGVVVFAETGTVGAPEVVYVPVRTGCEFQPYVVDTGGVEPEAGGSAGPRAIEIPRALAGYLEVDDGQWEGAHYDDYVFMGASGQSIVAEMRSEDVDAILHLGRFVDGELQILVSNDDGFDACTDARLVGMLPADGEYVLRATSYDLEFGPYVLIASEEGSEPDWSGVSVRAGDHIAAELTLADALYAEDTHFDEYTIDVRAGEHLVITLTSGAFDTYLSIERQVGDELQEIDASDDAPGLGTDSQIDITFDEAGTYLILASSYDPDTAGPYELTVEAR
ncbi:MAG: PPC domain-containing protein [Gemmatimonadales bacterium]